MHRRVSSNEPSGNAYLDPNFPAGKAPPDDQQRCLTPTKNLGQETSALNECWIGRLPDHA